MTLRSPQPLILMTIDAVGGVWRYAMDLAAALRPLGFSVGFVGLGPRPSAAQYAEAQALGSLRWLDLPLDWMVEDEAALAAIGPAIAAMAETLGADLLHLNLPSQAAGLETPLPVVVASHSCVVTWFAAVRHADVPAAWQWQKAMNRRGFERANAVIAPSGSHQAMVAAAYGKIDRLHVVFNASRRDDGRAAPAMDQKQDFVLAAGRWWDEGKNGAVLDEAAITSRWPVVMVGASCGPQGQSLEIRHAECPGECAHAEVLALMRKASVFVSPSIYEPFGLAPLEAAHQGAALLLADIPTYRELWQDAALFFDPFDAAGLAEAINLLSQDADHRTELAARARQRARRFDPVTQARAMARLYRGLLDHNVSHRSAEAS